MWNEFRTSWKRVLVLRKQETKLQCQKKKQCSSQIKIFVFYSKSKVSSWGLIRAISESIFVYPSSPVSLLSCISPVLHPSFPASHLSCIPPFMHPTFPASLGDSLLFSIPPVLNHSSPESHLSCIPPVLYCIIHVHCPASFLFRITYVLNSSILAFPASLQPWIPPFPESLLSCIQSSPESLHSCIPPLLHPSGPASLMFA